MIHGQPVQPMHEIQPVDSLSCQPRRWCAMWRSRRLARTWSGCLDHLATSRAPACPASSMATTGSYDAGSERSHVHAARTLQTAVRQQHCVQGSCCWGTCINTDVNSSVLAGALRSWTSHPSRRRRLPWRPPLAPICTGAAWWWSGLIRCSPQPLHTTVYGAVRRGEALLHAAYQRVKPTTTLAN